MSADIAKYTPRQMTPLRREVLAATGNRELARKAERYLPEVTFLGIRTNADGSLYEEQQFGFFQREKHLSGAHHLIFALPRLQGDWADEFTDYATKRIYDALGIAPDNGVYPSLVVKNAPENNTLLAKLEDIPVNGVAARHWIDPLFLVGDAADNPECKDQKKADYLIIPVTPAMLKTIRQNHAGDVNAVIASLYHAQLPKPEARKL